MNGLFKNNYIIWSGIFLGGRSSHTWAALLTLGQGAASLWYSGVQLNLALGIKLGLQCKGPCLQTAPKLFIY